VRLALTTAHNNVVMYRTTWRTMNAVVTLDIYWLQADKISCEGIIENSNDCNAIKTVYYLTVWHYFTEYFLHIIQLTYACAEIL